MTTALLQTPSQTVGPFFAYALVHDQLRPFRGDWPWSSR